MAHIIKIVNLVLFGFLLTFQTNIYAEVSPQLLGVWQSEKNNRGSVKFKPDHLLVHEFKEDGSWTTWTFKEGRTPDDFKLTLKEHVIINSISPGKFKYTKNNKKMMLSYTLENGRLILIPKKGRLISSIFRKKDFTDKKRNGNYQLHSNHAYEALISDAIKHSKTKVIDQLLASPKAGFLKKSTGLFSYENGSYTILSRIWESAVKSGNTKSVSILNKHFPDFSSTHFISRIKRNSDPKMVSYLQKINHIDTTSLNDRDISGIDTLLALESWAETPLFFQKKINQNGCVYAGRSVGTDEERIDDSNSRNNDQIYWGNQRNGTLNKNKKVSIYDALPKIDATARIKEFEKALRLCLSNFLDKKPISKRVLNGMTVPGKSNFSGLMTILHYYSDYSVAGKTGYDKSPIDAYTIIKVLLEFGADPNIKPSKKAPDLRENMAKNANHQRFTVRYKQHSDWLAKNKKLSQQAQYEYDLITAEIKLYNQIMKMIGGQPYGSKTPTKSTNKEQPTKTTVVITNKSGKKTAATKKIKSAKQTTITNTSKVKSPISKNSLVGCWNWSNGPHIVINKNGSVRNGTVNATWKYINKSKNSYAIIWPSLADSISLIKKGTQLYGFNNLGFPILATRKSGTSSSLVGTWLWSNNITVHINSNKTVAAGHLHGTWHQSGKNWIIEWPIIDNIVMAKDGRSLTVKNQFGAVTAKRDVNCKE